MPPQEVTALVVFVPESEPVIESFRQKHDPVAAAEMPAHITLLYPFRHPDAISDELLEELRLLVSRHSAFPFSLVGVGSFPGVLYLIPEPVAPFERVTRALTTRYPETPPYSGLYPDVVPHLTVGYAVGEELCSIEKELHRTVTPALPIRSRAEAIWLVEKREGRWRPHTSFTLGGSLLPGCTAGRPAG
jgi:2'-5' RNA ligase